jgi:hypothetical protein
MISLPESPVERDTKIAVASANIPSSPAGASQCQFESGNGHKEIAPSFRNVLPQQILDDVRALSAGHLKQMRYRRFPHDAARKITHERETEFKMENDVDELLRRTMARGMGDYL